MFRDTSGSPRLEEGGNKKDVAKCSSVTMPRPCTTTSGSNRTGTQHQRASFSPQRSAVALGDQLALLWLLQRSTPEAANSSAGYCIGAGPGEQPNEPQSPVCKSNPGPACLAHAVSGGFACSICITQRYLLIEVGYLALAPCVYRESSVHRPLKIQWLAACKPPAQPPPPR